MRCGKQQECNHRPSALGSLHEPLSKEVGQTWKNLLAVNESSVEVVRGLRLLPKAGE